ncbi:MAG: mobile mystery protein B [Reyranella sp.]|uniref:mobile mystery protein B n=1 Tax=Reyranella sp. TaxID=1929291 RepID=UPI001AD0E3E4|nr:mobile mystery protein B [Reyranella sp.]MBN9088049.1 mobile mystery protein B [Reyranella sp.]
MIGPFDADDDATPLSPPERDGLIPTHVALRRELNELEQSNIADGDRWAFSRRRQVLDERFLRNLHRRMFERVWKWAGVYRATERNIGIESWRIEAALHEAIEDARYWIENGSYPADELAVRFHHRLVLVHPFPNGNGRWSRLAADLLVVRLSGPRFSWGSANLQPATEARRAYIAALRAADRHDLGPLIAFARS